MKKAGYIAAVLLIFAAAAGFSRDYNTIKETYSEQFREMQTDGSAASGGSENTGVYEFKPAQGSDAGNSEAENSETEEVVVTARQIPETLGATPRNLMILDGEDLRAEGFITLKDVLDDAPGIIVTRSNACEGVAGVMFRGARSNQTKVMVDGIPVNDITTGMADLNLIDISNVLKIEIVEGGLSSIYGADSSSGVINVITGSKEIFWAQGAVFYGSNNTQKYSLSSNNRIYGVDYAVSAGEEKSGGYIREEDREYFDAAGNNADYLKRFLNVKAGFSGDAFDTVVSGSYFSREMGVPYDAAGTTSSARQWDDNISAGADIYTSIGRINLKAGGFYRQAELKYVNEPYVNDKHIKTHIQGNLIGVYEESEYVSLITGYEISVKGVDSTTIGEKSVLNNGAYSNAVLKLLGGRLVINTGARADINEAYGTMHSENITAKYDFGGGVEVKGSFDRAFSEPTLNDLYWPEDMWTAGNPDLVPAQSASYEIALHKKSTGLNYGITLFKTETQDLIDWLFDVSDFKYKPMNISKADFLGVNIAGDVRLFGFMEVKAAYNYLEARDGEGDALAYRPKDKITASVKMELPYASEVTLKGEYAGPRPDAAGEEMDEYYTFDVSALHKVNKNFTLFLDVSNILDKKDYHITAKYPVPGRLIMSGVKAVF
ncbi:MAG: TonB-dependent receptor plug domain-containing protein [Candidatus Goldiibacteriota bacterium]